MNAGMWTANLVSFSLQLAIVVLVGVTLPHLFRVRHPRVMLWYWQALLVFGVTLPLLAPWEWTAETPGSVTAGPLVLAERALGDGSLPVSVGGAAALLIAAGVFVRLAGLAFGFRRLRSCRRRALRLDPLPAVVANVESRVGVRAEFYLSTDLGGPVTFGLVRPVVLLPSDFLDMDEEFQRSIACHELLHVRRRDWVFVLAEDVLRALLWFHPCVWWVLGRIQLAREQVVDREVLEVTQARRPYMEALLHIASCRERARFDPAPLFSRESHLAQRIALLVKEVTMSKRRLVFSAALMAGCVLATGTLAARAFPLGSPSDSVAAVPESSAAAPAPAQDAGGEVKPVQRVQPFFPQEAKDKGIEGEVVVEFTIDEAGTVIDARAIRGPELLQPPSLHAMRQWRFENPTGKKVIATTTFRFSLDKKEGTT